MSRVKQDAPCRFVDVLGKEDPPTDTSFTVSHYRSKSRCCEVIELAGELDMASAHQLEAVLDEMMAPKHIIIDASQLTFIDSSGLRLLLRASNLVQGRIWIKGASRHVSRVLDVSGVSGLFCLEQVPVVAHRTIARRQPRLAASA